MSEVQRHPPSLWSAFLLPVAIAAVVSTAALVLAAITMAWWCWPIAAMTASSSVVSIRMVRNMWRWEPRVGREIE